MGEIIEIREQVNPREFRIQYTTTGEEHAVWIDADKNDLFLSRATRSLRTLVCPFLRENSLGKLICTVHDSRPELCQQYSCFRVLVCDPEGNRIGRVWDASRYFTTADPLLREVWNREIAGREIPDETTWEIYVAKVLTGKGYRVVR
jgi:Fe-S-cluster containining protein